MKFKKMEKLPSMKLLPRKPLMCQVYMQVHIKEEQEYHFRAYVIRVNGASTEFLIADLDHKLR